MTNIKEITKLVYALSTEKDRADFINDDFLELVTRLEKLYKETADSALVRDREYGEALELLIKESDKQVKGYLKKVQSDYDKKVSSVNGLLNGLEDRVSLSETDFKMQLKEAKNELKDFADKVSREQKALMDSILGKISNAASENKETFNKSGKKLKDFEDALEAFRKDINGRLASVASRGGSMNRQVLVGGTDPLTRYTDYNLIAGTGMTISPVNNDAKRRVDITLTSSGGAGFSVIAVSGTINDSNKSFTAASQPTLLNINGPFYQQTGGIITWTYSGGTITLSQAVGTGGSIFGI